MYDPLTAFVLAYRMAHSDLHPVVRCDPLRAFVLAYEGAVLALAA
jgi:hypothetical protein